MIVSRALNYVYIAIPRTGSKSMCKWLVENYQGEWLGYHHQWQVPDEFRGFLIFTLVRNPYDREVSAWFFEPVIKSGKEPPRPQSLAEVMRETIPLKDGTVKLEGTSVPEVRMNQKNFVDKAGVSLVLHFEQLPTCLRELPFVHELPPFPHENAGGYRPPGTTFFDLFTSEEEDLVWQYASEDFAAFGYERFNCGPPVVTSKPPGGDT